MEKPMASAVNKTVSDAQAPTADSACWPLKLPTMMVSAVLYSCCSRFPAMIGRANCTMSFQGVPRVRSLVMMRSSPVINSYSPIAGFFLRFHGNRR